MTSTEVGTKAHAEPPLVVSIGEAARMLGVSHGTIHRMARDGELLGVFMAGNAWRVPVSVIEDYQRAHRYGAPIPERLVRSAAHARSRHRGGGHRRRTEPGTVSIPLTRALRLVVSQALREAMANGAAEPVVRAARRSGWDEHGAMGIRLHLLGEEEAVAVHAVLLLSLDRIEREGRRAQLEAAMRLVRAIEAHIPAGERALTRTDAPTQEHTDQP